MTYKFFFSVFILIYFDFDCLGFDFFVILL